MRTMIYGFLGLLVALSVNCNPTKSNMDLEKSAALTGSMNQFSADFYKKVAEEKPGENLIMSPFSAHTILALLTMGAKSETLNEINKALYLPDVEFTKSAYKPTIQRLNTIKGITLNVANKVYVKDGKPFELSPEFKNLAVDVFSSEIQNIDFNKPDAASKDINTWVEKHTNNKIKDLISPDALNDLTRLVLVNAIYFKGDWNSKFDPTVTTKQPFYVNSSKTIEVDMMFQTADFPYAFIPEWDAQMVELPYVGQEASMVIILPNEKFGLKDLEEKMAKSDFTTYLGKLEEEEVRINLPKFKIEAEIDLKSVLQKLGMKKAFIEGQANLSGLLKNDEKLFVSDAIQKAFIEVNEEGAEAAAASGVFITLESIRSRFFTADHPFVFKILTKNRDVLFSGRFLK